MSATVRDVMSSRVVSVRAEASFREMADMLHSSRFSGFPVLDRSGRVVGVVSEADLLVKAAVQAEGTSWPAALRHVREDDKALGVTARDLMTAPAITIGPDAPVADAARLMYDRKVKRLPVVSQAGHLLGIISRVDVLTVVSRPDDDIRAEIAHRVLPEFAAGRPADFDVAVREGIVTVSGPAQDERVRRALAGEIRHVRGVVAVRDRLS